MSLAHLIPSLEPKLRGLYDKHRERATKIDWSYHEYLPLDELKADPNSIPHLSPLVYTAVETALLTEVNLPWFTTQLYGVFKGSLAVMLDFLHTWTSEEDSHALLLETYLLLGSNGDTKLRSAMRRGVIRQGWAANIETHFGAIAYTAIQELATQTFYLRVATCRAGRPDVGPCVAPSCKRRDAAHGFLSRCCQNPSGRGTELRLSAGGSDDEV